MKFSTHAIIAVTMNCNSKCTMCDIWKNKIVNEMKPDEYLRLPATLKDINITGGEPFLRMDLPEIIRVIKKASPKARLVLNTNGYLPLVIKKQIKTILKIDPKFAVRVSVDGWEKIHDEIRRIPNGFRLIMESIKILKMCGAKDLGINFTIMKANINDLQKVFKFAKEQGIEFSLTMVTDSPIYFGSDKASFRPDPHQDLSKHFGKVIVDRFNSIRPKEWFRGWFEQQLLQYYLTNRRRFPCDAGSNFFYLDSLGHIYTCHIKNWLLGDLREKSFQEIWDSERAGQLRINVNHCQGCWMMCTAKTGIRSNLPRVAYEVFKRKVANLL